MLKYTKEMYRLLFVSMLTLIHLGVSAQQTVSVRKLWSDSYSTTYSINTYGNPSYAPSNKSTTSNESWNSSRMPAEVAGMKGYETLISKTISLFYKPNKILAEYDKLRSYAFTWYIIYESPKDPRLREFYRFHNMHDIFGDEEATILEHY